VLINPLVAFYDIHGGKRGVLFFYFVPGTTRDDDDDDDEYTNFAWWYLISTQAKGKNTTNK
jgi:hypothetical protein